MSIGKRVTYLKGLAEGLNLGNDTKEEKLLRVIIEILEDMAVEIEDLADSVVSLDDDVSVLVEDMQDLEDMFFDDEDDEEADCCCPPPPVSSAKSGNENEGTQHQLYAVECPSCQSEITIDEDVLKKGSIDCPNCGELLEFEE